MAADVCDAGRARRGSRRRSSAAATWPTCSPALAVGLDAGQCRSTEWSSARARWRRLVIAARFARCTSGDHRPRRRLQRQPVGGRARARGDRRRARLGAPRRGARRDARARTGIGARCTRAAAAPPRAPASACSSPSAATPRARSAPPRWTPGSRPPPCAMPRPATRRRRSSPSLVRAGDLVLVKGFAVGVRASKRVVDRAGRGAWLMLYHLLFSLHDYRLGAERDSLHHVPHRRRQHHRDGHQPGGRADPDPAAEAVPVRPGDSARGPGEPSARRPARRRWAGC